MPPYRTVMATTPPTPDPLRELQAFVIERQPPLYVVGTFDAGITVLRQQVRALNLAWALIEAGRIPAPPAPPTRIAVVGAGFAGLTFSAAMLAKKVNCHITLFEEHDTLLPLQQGSDTRWLHPHIYDWPDEGSEADVAMLPLLNWTAARASDVVVQILQDWRRLVRPHNCVRLFCNARHLQVAADQADPAKARVEWVGEGRDPSDGTATPTDSAACGCAERFDEVVLAVGFGIEDGQPSYWRNETMGQPNLHQHKRIHLVSGQGDGAMIDLLRVRISQYRQDRILEETFAGAPGLVVRLREIKAALVSGSGATNMFDSLDQVFQGQDAKLVLNRLARRLRRDSDAVLQLKVRELAELLGPPTRRISFQNALLVYMLYKVGGFAPSTEDEGTLRKRYAIPADQVVRRHGTKRLSQLHRILSAPLFQVVATKIGAGQGFATQRAETLWPGGYFGYPGPTADIGALTDEQLRSVWRKEYLPGPTSLVAASICGAVFGMLREMRPALQHVRITLHRVLPLGQEILLQQACDYVGQGFEQPRSTAGRTFPTGNAMIGLAWRCRRPARTKRDASRAAIQEAMRVLNLHAAARNMLPDVSYVLAMPIIQPKTSFHPPNPVVAVLYLDSKDEDFALSEAEVNRLSGLVRGSFQAIVNRPFAGVRNTPFLGARSQNGEDAEELPTGVSQAIEVLDLNRAPLIDRAFVLNFDRSDPASLGTVEGAL